MLELVTAATDLPVTLNQARQECGVIGGHDDHRISLYVKSVTGHFDGKDGVLRRALMPQTWCLSVPMFMARIELPLPPYLELVSVEYHDSNGELQTYVGAEVEQKGDRGVLRAADNGSWPDTQSCRSDAVKITFRAGYPDAGSVPAPIVHAILMGVRASYDGETMPKQVHTMTRSFRVVSL